MTMSEPPSDRERLLVDVLTEWFEAYQNGEYKWAWFKDRVVDLIPELEEDDY